MSSYKAYKFRLYPNKEQAHLIDRTIGCVRLVYNSLLDDYKQQLDNGVKPALKQVTWLKKVLPFLNDVDSLALANAKLNLQTALTNFFNSRNGKRKGRKAGFPKRHKKNKSKWRYTTNNQHNGIRIENGRIRLPKLKFVKVEAHRPISGIVKSCTIEKTRSGQYFVSVLCETSDECKERKIPEYGSLKVVGLDMSFSSFAVSSDTNDDTKPKYVREYRKHEKRLARLQRRVSRKVKGSHNRYKARERLAKLSEHVANKRLDFCHKLSRTYAMDYDVIVIENLDMRSMSRTLNHGKSVHDL